LAVTTLTRSNPKHLYNNLCTQPEGKLKAKHVESRHRQTKRMFLNTHTISELFAKAMCSNASRKKKINFLIRGARGIIVNGDADNHLRC